MRKEHSIEINKSAAEVWALIGDRFGDTGLWTSQLDSSHMVGEVDEGGHRVCKIGTKTLTENLTLFDPQNLVLEYDLIEGRPPIISTASNRWSVTALGPNRSRVTMRPDTKLKWWAGFLGPLIRSVTGKILAKVLEELKFWVETGEVHPRKKAQDAKRAG